MSRGRGDKNSKHAIALRQEQVAALKLQGVDRADEIAQIVDAHRTTIYRDLAELDLAADQRVESIEMRVKHRTNELERYRKLDQIIADSKEMSEGAKVAAWLAVSDRRSRLLGLDDSATLPKAGDAPVTVVLNVEFEDAADVAAQKESAPPVPAPLALPPKPEEPTPAPMPAAEREMTTEEALALIEQIRNPDAPTSEQERMKILDLKNTREYFEGSRAIENLFRRKP